MIIKKTLVVLILIMTLLDFGYGQNDDLKYKNIENIEYTYQKVINYDKQLDTLKTLNFSARKMKIIEERLNLLKQDQEDGQLHDTLNTTLLIYNGEPEKILIVIGRDTIVKDELNFSKVTASQDCVIRYKNRAQFAEIKRSRTTKEIEIYWLARKKNAKVEIDLSYSYIEIESELDLELEEIYIEGRDKYGLPIPKVKMIKEPDKIIVNHSNW